LDYWQEPDVTAYIFVELDTEIPELSAHAEPAAGDEARLAFTAHAVEDATHTTVPAGAFAIKSVVNACRPVGAMKIPASHATVPVVVWYTPLLFDAYNSACALMFESVEVIAASEPLLLAEESDARTILDSIPMIAITTNSSIRVNPFCNVFILFKFKFLFLLI
jgi:hypothetical protein